MISKIELIEKIHQFISIQLNSLSQTSPEIAFLKPLINRVLKNRLNGLTDILDLITEENGNIDIENIINEMSSSIINTKPFSVKIPSLGKALIGDGKIEVEIPYINKSVVLKEADIKVLKETLIDMKNG